MSGNNVCWQIVTPKATGELIIIFGSDPLKDLDFEEAANYLAKKLKRKYKCKSPPKPIKIDNGGDMMKLLMKKRVGEKRIKELHIFSHSWFSGLSLNYGGTAKPSDLKSLEEIYGKNVKEHIGSDDYNEFKETQIRISNFHYLTKEQQKTLMKNFAPGARIKMWGCNTGSGSGGIAQTFANYTRAATYGSPSGTDFKVYVKGEWIKYNKEVQKKYGRLVRQCKIPFMMFPDSAKKYKKFKSNKKVNELNFKKLKPKVPSISWLDKDMNIINHDQTDTSLYSIKCGEMFLLELVNVGESYNKTVKFFENSGQVNTDKLMNVQKHPNWKLKGGNIEITKGNLFQADAKAYNNYFKNKRFWIEVKWSDKSFNSKGKNEIRFIR
jgi:hypothetical protein